MNRPIAAVRFLALWNVPQRMAWRVMMPKKISTLLSHEHPVGVKWRLTRGVVLQPGPDLRVLVGGVVVADGVQPSRLTWPTARTAGQTARPAVCSTKTISMTGTSGWAFWASKRFGEPLLPSRIRPLCVRNQRGAAASADRR
jgi:hypothetical protein